MNKKNKKKNKDKNKNKFVLDKKTILLILTPIVVVASIIFIVAKINNYNKKETEPFKIEGIDIIDKKDILKDTQIDNLNITNQVMYNSGSLSNYSAIITNDSNSDVNIESLYVVFTINNEDRKILALSNGIIKANNSLPIMVSFDSDVSNVTNIKIEVNKKQG